MRGDEELYQMRNFPHNEHNEKKMDLERLESFFIKKALSSWSLALESF